MKIDWNNPDDVIGLFWYGCAILLGAFISGLVVLEAVGWV